MAFKKVPITFGRPAWTNVAKLYYALETTGDLAKLDEAVFKAIHEQRVNLFDPRTAEEWVGKQGADGKKFAEAFASFGVNSKMSRAEQIARAYKVDGVPMVVVDGRYVVKGEAFKDVLRNADLLIEKIRAERAGKRSKPRRQTHAIARTAPPSGRFHIHLRNIHGIPQGLHHRRLQRHRRRPGPPLRRTGRHPWPGSPPATSTDGPPGRPARSPRRLCPGCERTPLPWPPPRPTSRPAAAPRTSSSPTPASPSAPSANARKTWRPSAR